MMHRVSTGVVQRIEPGALNGMTAGRGIVHSKRTPDDLRSQLRRSRGLQLWAAFSRKERIVQAQDDWRAKRFDAVPGETEFIPLP